MFAEIPQYALRAYALFLSKYGSREEFKQSELDWVVGTSMKKKIFSLLLNKGWIKKSSKNTYICNEPKRIMKGLLEFKVPDIIKNSKRKYAFTRLSAIEIWSDYSYVQRSIKKSPYFIKVLKKDLDYWKKFFNGHNIPNYIKKGTTIGEHVILFPVSKINPKEKNNLKVQNLNQTMEFAKSNEIYKYPYNYMRKKYA
jgi:hypothetical protein